ncbi:MAG: hypothetical protein ACRERC_12745 [Candidatus Binatia bacterium]
MKRLVVVGAALLAALIGAGVSPARADSCSPAMCAGMSPVCWLAYEKIMVNKESKFASIDQCNAVVRDLEGQGSWLQVKGLTPAQGLCACEAAFWSLDGPDQGLPNIQDTGEEDDNRSDDDDGGSERPGGY